MEPIRVSFQGSGPFHHELKRRVDAYFQNEGISPRDVHAMYLKTAIIFSWTIASWVLLVFYAQTWWQALPAGVALGMGMAGIGFSIQHDANHGGYSGNKLVNRLLSYGLDLIGGSSYVWYYKHNIAHHTYTNVSGVDIDIDIQPLLRLASDQEWKPYYRLQPYYIWILYGFLPLNWHFRADYRDLIAGHVGIHPFPAPTKLGLAATLLGKLFFYSWSLFIPMMYHPFWVVIGMHLFVSWTLGMILTTTFQLAHCLEEADFVTLDGPDTKLETEWAEHQVRTTANFAPKSAFLTWYLGGLNYQIEHHLFPKVCHMHYPKISPVVAEVCKEYGIPYEMHPTVWKALASHLRRIREFAKKPDPVPAAV